VIFRKLNKTLSSSVVVVVTVEAAAAVGSMQIFALVSYVFASEKRKTADIGVSTKRQRR